MSRTPGYTLLELVVGLTLLTILMGSVIMTTQRGIAAYRRSASNSSLDAKVNRALSRLARELVDAGGANLVPNPTPPLGGATLDFQRPVAWTGGAIVWGPTVRFALELAPGELDNGIDDNGNGLIDEGVLVRIENPGLANEQRSIFSRGVSEYLEGETGDGTDENGNGLVDEGGLSFSRSNGSLQIALSLERIGPDGELMVRTLGTSVALRN